MYIDAFASQSGAESQSSVLRFCQELLDEEVAYLMVKGCQGNSSMCPPQQQAWLKVSEKGPFKDKNYTY